MRLRALLVCAAVVAGMFATTAPASAATDAACAADPRGDERSGFEPTDYDPADILRACFRYTPDALLLDVGVAKPLPLTDPAWKDGYLHLEIYPHDMDGTNRDSPIAVTVSVVEGKLVSRARPIVYREGEDWECTGSGAAITDGYRAIIPWGCVRIQEELRFSYRIILNAQQWAHNDVHNDGLCCGHTPPSAPPPPPAEPSRPAVTVRNTDSACPPGSVPEDGMTDADGNAHEVAIDCTMWWGVTTQTGPGRFSPGTAVSRGQMADWIARYLDRTGGQLPETADDRFSDTSSSPFRQSINRIAEAGVVGGYPDGTFRPETPVTRAQMAKFIAAAYRFGAGHDLGSTATDWFWDDEGNVHESWINRIASAGVAAGTRTGVYSPQASISRAQMASFLARLLDVAVDGGQAAPPSG